MMFKNELLGWLGVGRKVVCVCLVPQIEGEDSSCLT